MKARGLVWERERQWKREGAKGRRLCSSLPGLPESSWLACVMWVWACRSVSVADKWPSTTCGERSILTIISSSFPFISSDLSVAPVLHHNKLQHSNPLMFKALNTTHNTHTHTHTLTTHPFPFRQNGAEDRLKFNTLGTHWKNISVNISNHMCNHVMPEMLLGRR